jgi:thiol-disulfide isomerase/thioredoxin
MTMPPTMHGALSSLDGATEWVNSQPLTAAALRGKVVAVQFCTYSCVNWIRTLPYVRAWADRYRDDGLVVVGAHAPEFTFERNRDGVRRAMEAMGVGHPIVLDNEYAIWSAFDNRFWPALYVLDGDGGVRYDHFGEGAYEESEAAIQRLLGVDGDPVHVEPAGIEAPADWDTVRSPETYVGATRGERRAAGGAAAGPLVLNAWALTGRWAVEGESALLEAAGGSIAYRFEARDLNLVLTQPARGGGARFTVRLDGEAPGPAHGADTDEHGAGTVDEPRLYQLVRQPGAVAERTFEIEFLDPGVRAYVFTFG